MHKHLKAGADPGRTLTRVQPKARGRGNMDVVLSVGLDKRDSLKSSNSSVECVTFYKK